MLPKGLLKEYSQVLLTLLRSLDIFAILIAGLLAHFYKFGNLHLSPHYQAALLIAALLTFFVFPYFHIYESNRGKNIWYFISSLMQAIAAILILLAGLAFLTKTGEQFSRIWFLTWAIFSFILFGFSRLILFIILRLMRARGWNERRVIIIGASDLGLQLVESMQEALWTGFRILAIFDDKPQTQSSKYDIPILAMPSSLSEYLSSQNSIDEIWIALPLHAEKRVKEILHELRNETVTTRLVLDIFGMDLFNHSITDLAGYPVLNIRSSPMTGINRIIKAFEDRILASLILILISPLFLMIALLIKLSSKGPVFYKQKRVGWNNKEFEMLKFRSMPVNVEENSGPVWAKANENRATKIGNFLRKTSLDELPQFLNVLRGDMSIVGPRPERAFFVEQFKKEIPRYMQKHLMKAGITGWAQIHGWRGNTSLEKRIEYDLYYIENWSLFLDLKIIFLTLFRGFVNKNAY